MVFLVCHGIACTTNQASARTGTHCQEDAIVVGEIGIMVAQVLAQQVAEREEDSGQECGRVHHDSQLQTSNCLSDRIRPCNALRGSGQHDEAMMDCIKETCKQISRSQRSAICNTMRAHRMDCRWHPTIATVVGHSKTDAPQHVRSKQGQDLGGSNLSVWRDSTHGKLFG